MMSAPWIHSDGHLTDEAVALYIDALHLDRFAMLPEVIKAHVENCLQCKAAVLSLSEVVDATSLKNAGQHPFFDAAGTPAAETAPDRVFRMPRHIAVPLLRAAAVLLVGISLFLAWYLAGGKYSRETLLSGADSAGTASPADTPAANPPMLSQQLAADPHADPALQQPAADTAAPSSPDLQARYAANFEPSPNLEDLISEAYRSGEIELLSPTLETQYHGKMHFRWKTAYGGSIYLKILNHQEEPLYQYETAQSEFSFTQPLPPGLYYWKLETDEELLQVGKFTVGVE